MRQGLERDGKGVWGGAPTQTFQILLVYACQGLGVKLPAQHPRPFSYMDARGWGGASTRTLMRPAWATQRLRLLKIGRAIWVKKEKTHTEEQYGAAGHSLYMMSSAWYSEAHYSATSGLGPRQRITVLFLSPELFGVLWHNLKFYFKTQKLPG